MPCRSPTGASSATGRTDFSTGTDSPVSTASSMRRDRTSISRRSAGTLSPDCKSTTSPGTSCSAGTVMRRPSRSTAAEGDNRFRTASSAASALPSWMKPIRALSTTTATMTAVST
jgi:hypothetical protein